MARSVAVATLATVTIAVASSASQALAAAPAPPTLRFPAATTQTLPNGVVIASQASPDTPIVSANIFLPAGAAQQPLDKGGVAGVTAAVILATRVDGDRTLSQVASDAGAALSYTIDPQNTRFSIECKSSDLPRLMSGLAAAMKAPDPSALPNVRKAALETAHDAITDPAMTAFSMIRQSQYAGTGYARLDQGDPTALARLNAADVGAFASEYRHGHGTAVALTGDVTPDALAAAKAAFGDFASTPAPRGIAPPKPRPNQLVAHREVAAPWVAVGFSVPSQFSPDFPVMLVIEALLGHGGDVHTFSYGSDAALPAGFVGGDYQYEAEPGMLIEFYNGADIFDDLRTLNAGVTRLRSSALPSALVDEAKAAAAGTFLTSVATLDDESWLLGRSALSPSGVDFENQLTARIAKVTAADVERVSKRYLGTQILALVSPAQNGP